jgi:hypothetical protein
VEGRENDLVRHLVSMLLKQSQGVGLNLFLYKVLKVPALRREHFRFRFFLTNRIQVTDLSNDDLALALLILVYNTEEVKLFSLVGKDRCYIKLVFKQGESLESVLVDVGHQLLYFLSLLTQKGVPVNSHVHPLYVFWTSLEVGWRQLLITVEVSLQLGGHSKIVYEERVLVGVLKETELAALEGEAPAILKVLVRVDDALFADFVLEFLLSCDLELKLSEDAELLLNYAAELN